MNLLVRKRSGDVMFEPCAGDTWWRKTNTALKWTKQHFIVQHPVKPS